MSEKPALGREGILAFKVKPTIEEIETPALGRLFVRRMNYGINAAARKYLGTSTFDLAIFVQCVVDEAGTPLFALTDEDLAQLSQLPSAAINEVLGEIIKLNNAAEEAEIKNSEASPTPDSPTDSEPISE